MFKIDIQHAFRLLPVKQSQWSLLGMQWLGPFYINTRLPFGLQSAPSIFNKFADLVCWIIQNITNNPNFTHYSDNYFIVKSQDLQETGKELINVKHILEHLNIPIATEEIEGPSTTITYLGIQINSHNQTIQLPDDKLHELITLLSTWLHKKKCTQKELLSNDLSGIPNDNLKINVHEYIDTVI